MPDINAQSAFESLSAPRIDSVDPAAALPLGEVELTGANLGPLSSSLPVAEVGGHPAQVLMSRPTRLVLRVPDQTGEGFAEGTAEEMIEIGNSSGTSNAVPLCVAHRLSEGLHPVTNPVVSRSGMIYATISGARGKQTPVSVVRVSPDGRGTPFVTGILNPTGLAFNADGDLFVTSRAEGNVYRVDAAGESTTYVEGMGTATGAVFDREGNLFVGDRSGTIFKIDSQRNIFVHATLEASVSAYHLAINATGTLFVTAPTLISNDAIWAIEPNGETHVWYRGLGRPQGLALSKNGDIYLAACLRGQRGLVRITPQGDATLVLAGANIVGLAFSPLGSTILATGDAVYDVNLGVEGLNLF